MIEFILDLLTTLILFVLLIISSFIVALVSPIIIIVGIILEAFSVISRIFKS